MKKEFEINNANEVVEQFENNPQREEHRYLTLVQGNTFSDVKLNKNSTKSNCAFVVNHWHDKK